MSRRIETKTSRTAEWACISRATSYYETREQYKSGDWIAPLLVPLYAQPLVRIGFLRGLMRGTLAPRMGIAPGMYEYVTARTKYIDDAFQKALKDGVAQVLIFGAGFDSRAIRFQAAAGSARFFELDSAHTQQAKLEQYKRRHIAIPPNLVLVSIDFETQTLSQRLSETQFQKGVKSLFLLEGLTMYLEPETIDQTFTVIGEYAGRGSRIIFDYVLASVIGGEELASGETEIRQTVMRVGEQWRFGMERGQVQPFLDRYGFTLLEHQNAEELENRYFKAADGTIVGRVNRTHCIAIAEKT